MSTLWIFGDSFAEDVMIDGANPIPLANRWYHLLSDRLGMEHRNFALRGCGLDYTYQQWFDVQDEIRASDLAIIALTSFDRRWFIADKPQLSSIFNLTKGAYNSELSMKQLGAMINYVRYLHHPGSERAQLYNWLCCLDRAAAQGVRVLILPAFRDSGSLLYHWRNRFPNINCTSLGFLIDIQKKEFVEELRVDAMFNDHRCNHLVPSNHRILTDKIERWHLYGDVVDLTVGFQESIIHSGNLDDPGLFLYTPPPSYRR